MAGEERRKVTIEFGTDQASLDRALRDLDMLRQSLSSLSGGRGGQSVQPGAYQQPTGGVPPPPRPPVDFGAQGMAPFGGGGFGGGGSWAPMAGPGGSPFGGSWNPTGSITMMTVTTVTMTNVAVVNITATSVNVSGATVGGGGGEGPGGGADTGAAQAAQGGAIPYTRQPTPSIFTRGKLEAMGMSPGMAATLGQVAGQVMPYTPYMMLAAGIRAAGNAGTAYQQQLNVAGEMRGEMGIAAAGGAFISPGQQVAAQWAETDASRQAFNTGMKGIMAYQGLDFITGGTLSRYDMEVDRRMAIDAKATDLRARLQVMDNAYGTKRAAGVSTWTDAKQAAADAGVVGTPQENKYVNDVVQESMSVYNTPVQSALSALQNAGLTGMAGAVIPLLSGDNPLLAQSQLTGFTQGMSRMNPRAQLRAAFGKTTTADLQAASIQNAISGNWGIDARNAASSLPMGMAGFQSAAINYNEASEDVQLSATAAASAMAYAQEVQAKGGTAREVVSAMGGGVSATQAEISALRIQASTESNPVAKAQLNLQIQQRETQLASMTKTMAGLPFEQDISIARSEQIIAGARTERYGFMGYTPEQNPGYQESITAARAELEANIAKKNSPAWDVMDPSERKSLEAAIETGRVGVTQGYRRLASDTAATAGAAVSAERAGLSGSARWESMTGTPQSSYEAQMRLVATLQKLIEIEEKKLASGNWSPAERSQMQQNISQYQWEQKIQGESASREKFSSEIERLSNVQTSYAQTGARQSMLGGSLSSMGSQMSAVGTIRDKIATMQANLDEEMGKASPDGTRISGLQAALSAAKTEEASAMLGATSFSATPELALAGTMNSVYLSAVTKTYAGYGDVRRGLMTGMGIAGRKMHDLALQRDELLAKATPEQRPAIMAQFANEAAPIMNEAIGYQQALESGWQERLFSQVIGGGGNYDLIASRFTHRESSMFGGVANRFFGGSYNQMNYFRREAPMWYSSFNHAFSRPEGFMDTATQGMAGGEVKLGGDVRFHVILQDMHGNKLVNTTDHLNANASGMTATFKPNKGQMS